MTKQDMVVRAIATSDGINVKDIAKKVKSTVPQVYQHVHEINEKGEHKIINKNRMYYINIKNLTVKRNVKKIVSESMPDIGNIQQFKPHKSLQKLTPAEMKTYFDFLEKGMYYTGSANLMITVKEERMLLESKVTNGKEEGGSKEVSKEGD